MMKLLKTFLVSTVAITGFIALGQTVNAEEIKHVVTSEDTLSGLSLKYFGSTDYVASIAKDNNIENTNLIYDGEILTINSDTAQVTLPSTEQTVSDSAAGTTAEDTTTTQGQTTKSDSGKTLIMEATAYSSDPADTLGGGIMTATGQNLLENPMAVAVDPTVIPLGTRLYVEGYGEAIASDTGGAIKGNIIDVHFSTYAQCIAWGRRTVNVTILD